MWCAEFLHVKPGKGAAFVRTKLKNYITGNVVDRTFRGGETVQQAELEKKETQFTYQDGDDVRAKPLSLLSDWKC
jgi:translation elongation factor P/translation initiation factor 5A